MRQDTSADESRSRLAASLSDSRILRFFRGSHGQFSDVGRDPRARAIVERVRPLIDDSIVCQWFTATPCSERIELDLRGAYVLVPFFWLLDRLPVKRRVVIANSRLAVVGRAASTEFRTAPLKLFGICLMLGCVCAVSILTARGLLSSFRLVLLTGLGIAGLASTQLSFSWAELRESRIGRLTVVALAAPADTSSTFDDSDARSSTAGRSGSDESN